LLDDTHEIATEKGSPVKVKVNGVNVSGMAGEFSDKCAVGDIPYPDDGVIPTAGEERPIRTH
jgi:hypothetical protein